MTERQSQILAAIIEAYAEVNHPVGSVTLAKLFNVSSSTIRGEMGALERLGYIQQPHTSAGRIPTDKGYRWYVNNCVPTPEMVHEPVNELKVLEARIQRAGELDQALRSAMDSLVEFTSNAGFGTLGSHLYVNGLSYLLSQPEFASTETAQAAGYLLDNLEIWLRETNPNDAINVFIGQENPVGKAAGCSLIIGRFNSPYSDHAYIGVLGSTRQNYQQTMALVQCAGRSLQALWQAN